MAELSAYKSPEGRIRTSTYQRNGPKFCVVEMTSKGTLITEFGVDGQVTMQSYSQTKDFRSVLSNHLNGYDIDLTDVVNYDSVEMKASCSKCASMGLGRDLDRMPPSNISDVPVLPIFVCSKCGQKHYSLTDEYLRTLVHTNRDLFEEKELEEIDGDPDAAINTLREYIIRIFASKKISRAVTK